MKRFILAVIAALALALAVPASAQNVSGGTVTSKLGGSTTVGGIASGSLVQVTPVNSGTTQSTYYTIASVTIPASAFNAATRAIQCHAWGVTAGNANNKDFKVLVGDDVVYQSVASVTLNAKPWVADISIVRSGSSTQAAYASFWFDSPINTTFSGVGQTTAPDQAEASPIIVAVQSQNTSAAAASATGNGMVCTFLN